eukprot:scaffold33827_cov42-Phaeocystis_antarctica.AAC.1
MGWYSFGGAPRRTARHPPGVEGGFASSLRAHRGGTARHPVGMRRCPSRLHSRCAGAPCAFKRRRVCRHACAFRANPNPDPDPDH